MKILSIFTNAMIRAKKGELTKKKGIDNQDGMSNAWSADRGLPTHADTG